ncbi:MAG TPA: toxin-antitoxin system HicB family antitoxin [Gemmatimonadaceae bacterium]|nr:toxin-antitoxin system HicB family antitoxin [Gemmatimonadaceae bacterium]
MSSISLRLPESLHKQVRELAKREEISINQLIATALAEKMAALMTGEYLAERAKRGRRRKFEHVLGKVRARDAAPVEGDEL